jgi:ATP/maltotriose-dependent transcriptional regulator MalT
MLDHLQRGRDCFGRGCWTDAYQALRLADEAAALSGEDLERLSISAYMLGRVLEFEHLVVRQHRTQVQAGDRARGARCAFWLGLTLLFRGEVVQANAWIRRGQHAIARDECVEHGYLLLPLAEQQLRAGRAAEAHEGASTAASIGDRFGDADLTAMARHLQGRALILQDQVAAGLALLDETMLSVVAGDLSPIVTGLMYCSVIGACRQVYALNRAREWTYALSAWCERQSEALAFSGTCLVHRAEIMQFQGAWSDALAEARRACERGDGAERTLAAAALYQQAEIYRLRGEFAHAEEAYQAASRLGRDPEPGLALLRSAQGQVDAACAAIRQLVNATTDRMRRACLLPAYLEIMLAADELGEARAACDELREIAEAFDAEVLRATTFQAEGSVALAEGRVQAALDPLRHAFDAWSSLDSPHEAARVRVLIGLACRQLGDEETTALEFAAARAVFQQLNARPELERLDRLQPSASRDCRLSTRECDVLRLIARGYTNRVIAARLFVSERTIDRHVSNILTKLDVPSRAAATSWAYRHKML